MTMHEMSADSGLVARGLTVRFPGSTTAALDGVDLDVPRGRVVALLGPSGCGKSTALRVIAGLQKADGRLSYGGQGISRLPAYRRGFSLMFQDGQLFGHLDVFGNVAYGLKRQKASKSEITARVSDLLELVGLAGYADRAPATLSGGQQQRVALARALAPRPRLLLLDEPLSALDRTLRERLAGDLREVMSREHTTALFVTHDHNEALTVADDVALMRAGRIVQTGEAQQVWSHPADAEAATFLGYSTTLDAQESRALGLPEGAWALRRTSWQLTAPEAGTRGVISRLGGAGDGVLATVSLEALGGRLTEVNLPATQATGALRIGDDVFLSVDASRAARLP